MKNLTEYFNELTESVELKDNLLKVGNWSLDLSGKNVVYVRPPHSNTQVKILTNTPIDNSVPELVKWAIKAHLGGKSVYDIAKIVNRLYKEGDRDPKLFAVNEVDAMRKLKITTEVDLEETEGLYNTTDDRWSRRAKHQLSKNELQSAAEVSDFSKGDTAIFEGNEVEVRIPVGPNGTTGIMLEGHLKMVKRSDLQTLEEGFGVMGAMKPLGPLNRIMQLAGLEHSGAVVETEVEETDDIVEEDLVDETTDETVEETVELDEINAAAGTMFNQLLTANTNNPAYKNNPAAAKVATIGQVLAGLQGLMTGLPTNLPPATLNHIKMVPGIGAELIKTATAMTKPNTVMTKPTATSGVNIKK